MIIKRLKNSGLNFQDWLEAFPMSSITTAVAADYRLQQWAQLVKECQNRPSDMTVEQWCDTKGISKSNYYHRYQAFLFYSFSIPSKSSSKLTTSSSFSSS